MEPIEKPTIGSIVAENYKAATVFQKYGIDFCCKGNRTIEEACVSKGLNTEEVETEVLKATEEKTSAETDFNHWPLDALTDYITHRHHRYVGDKIPELTAYLRKVSSVHGERHPELEEIERLFSETAGELTVHMKKEELMLFPFIKRMALASRGEASKMEPVFGTVQNPIEMMMQEHADEGERFEKISVLSNGYSVPADGCTTYRVTYAMLKDFEEDLHQHIHLENNILFPKAVELEKQLR